MIDGPDNKCGCCDGDDDESMNEDDVKDSDLEGMDDNEYGDEDMNISPEKLAELQKIFKQRQKEMENEEGEGDNIADLKKKRKQNKKDLLN